MKRETLAEYLAKYIEHEINIDGIMTDDISILTDWIEQGIEAYMSINDIPKRLQDMTMDELYAIVHKTHKEHSPETCGCKYRGNDMWSCGHIDNEIQ